MKKLKSTLPNMLLSLGTITVLAGALLGGVYSATKAPIEAAAKAQQEQAIADVAPSFNNSPEADAKVFPTSAGGEATVYPAMRDDSLVGAAVKATSLSGFSGEIVIMVGFEADGTVKDYRVLQHAETPGLGAKMEAWFRDPAGARSILRRNPGTESFFVTKDTEKEGKVDAITAATISSRAFLEAVRGAYTAYASYAAAHGAWVAPALNDAAGQTGASKQKHSDPDTGADKN